MTPNIVFIFLIWASLSSAIAVLINMAVGAEVTGSYFAKIVHGATQQVIGMGTFYILFCWKRDDKKHA